jgi:Nucleotidyl transferase AbiEii toxin, Type IV TA system
MTAKDRYPTAAAFRRALEQRLRTEAQAAGVPLTRLRKEAAFYRLLARLDDVAPGRWAFKGGLSLIARIGEQVRGTKDADANWRATRAELEEALSAIERVDLDDWFVLTIGDAHEMLGEGDGGALRYPSSASLDGRLFEQLNLDINIVGSLDPRPVELVILERHIFEFIGEPPLQLPMVTPAQQLAEKLHAFIRTYDGEPSSRAKDLFDMLVIADLVRLPSAVALVDAARETFHVRTAAWPPPLTHPPRDWAGPWQGFAVEYPTRWADVTAAFVALREFWEPLFEERSTDAHWNPAQWRWIRH